MKRICSNFLFSTLLLITLNACRHNEKLPILGQRSWNGTDTLYSQIPDFTMTDQDNQKIQLTLLKGKANVACFFFTSCPTICPKVMRNIMRINQHFNSAAGVDYLCFSLDFKRDSISRLNEYYNKVGFTNPRIHLMRGNDPDQIKNLASYYMSTAVEDDSAPGGINHSGWILLSDHQRHLRSYALGTDEKDVDRLIIDIEKLLNEN